MSALTFSLSSRRLASSRSWLACANTTLASIRSTVRTSGTCGDSSPGHQRKPSPTTDTHHEGLLDVCHLGPHGRLHLHHGLLLHQHLQHLHLADLLLDLHASILLHPGQLLHHLRFGHGDWHSARSLPCRQCNCRAPCPLARLRRVASAPRCHLHAPACAYGLPLPPPCAAARRTCVPPPPAASSSPPPSRAWPGSPASCKRPPHSLLPQRPGPKRISVISTQQSVTG